MRGFRYFLLVLSMLLVFMPGVISSQGCSDAGACTLESLKPMPNNGAQQLMHKVSAGISIGVADYGITVFAGNIGYSGRLTERWRIDARITSLSQSGNGITNQGLGDAFLNINYIASQKFTFTAGAKIPFSKANKSFDGIPLPMDYQSSLGTFDALVGVKYTTDKWQWALAVQVPFDENENAFFPDLYDTTSILSTIQATNEFRRRPDILLHISRPIWMSNKFTFTPGLLPIYHLGEDQYTAIDGSVKRIEGSDGLTLNGTIYLALDLNETNTFEISLGFPFIVRDARPDGLTRGFVFGVAYAAEF